MTKEELEKEAEEYVKQNYCEVCVMADDCKSGCIDCFTVQAYLAGAEPREKQIQIDAEQIRALQKQNGELTDKVKELEAQIEKMKCCFSCRHSRTEYEHCRTDKHEKWEIKEK